MSAHPASAPLPEFVITRSFDAPRDLVFKAFTEVERLAQWWGPQGFALAVAEFDLRPGGHTLYSMTAPDGFVMWGKFTYEEITPPSTLVFINGFADATGQRSRHPMSANWPLEMLIRVSLEEAEGKTLLTLRSVPHQASAEECQVFADGFGSMTMGFGGTWDKLADYLAGAAH